MRNALLALSMSLAIATVAANEPQPRIGAAQRALTIEDRVAAQRAIEHVYYRHQIGVTKPFEQAVPRSVIEAKVRKYLEQTVALEVYWKTRVTNEMLGRELERMTGGEPGSRSSAGAFRCARQRSLPY